MGSSSIQQSYQPTVLLVEDDELVRDAMYRAWWALVTWS